MRFAAWVSVALALIAALLHLFVRPMGMGTMAIAMAVVWAAAMLQAIATPIRDATSAAWADRHLRGASAYATYLEAAVRPERTEATPALRRLVEWIEQAAPRSLAQLASISPDAGALKPVAAALVCTALTAVLLHVPVRQQAGGDAGSAGTAARATRTPAAALGPAADERVEADATSAAAAGAPEDGTERNGREASARVPATDDQVAAAEEQDIAQGSPRGPASSRAAAGGRDAGESPDTAADAGLSEAWQGAMASTLRSLAQPPQAAGRTDPTLEAEFATGAESGGAARGTGAFAPAAAVAPSAERKISLGPAEQAYVRAYFEGSGATP
jgi:hypothetical protein